LRHVLLHPNSAKRVHAYLKQAGHGQTPECILFQRVHRLKAKRGNSAFTADGVFKCVLSYAALAKITVARMGVHSLRATAATNALDHKADIAKVQEWPGHANIATTRIYDRRRSRPGN
jgi:site-specific recombinase XerD